MFYFEFQIFRSGKQFKTHFSHAWITEYIWRQFYRKQIDFDHNANYQNSETNWRSCKSCAARKLLFL